jgi:hypothetical protein
VVGGQAHFGIGYQFGRTSLSLELRYAYASAKGQVVAGENGKPEQIGGAGAMLKLAFEL